MKVKIKKCSSAEWWYNNLIGEVFEVTDSKDPDGDHQIIEDGELMGDFIFCDDFDVIEESAATPVDKNSKSIKVSLDTAREMYKDLCSRSDIASVNFKNWLLENFTKEELEPKKGFTWEDSFNGNGWWISADGEVKSNNTTVSPIDCNKNVFKTREQAESALAFAQLSHIVEKYNHGKAKPIWMFTVSIYKSKLEVNTTDNDRPNFHLCFFNLEDAETSLKVNRSLWEQYWMIKK